jgi:hypothetical protein
LLLRFVGSARRGLVAPLKGSAAGSALLALTAGGESAALPVSAGTGPPSSRPPRQIPLSTPHIAPAWRGSSGKPVDALTGCLSEEGDAP